MLRYNLRYQVFLMLSDALLVALALVVSSALRLTLQLGAVGPDEAFSTPPALYPMAMAIWLYALGRDRGYSRRNGLRLLGTLNGIVSRHALACLLFMGALYITYRDYSRLQSVYFMVLLLVFLLAHRIAMHQMRLALRSINTPRRVLIVGTDAHAARIAESIRDAGESGLTLIGFATKSLLDSPSAMGSEFRDEVLGTVEDLPALAEQYALDEVIVAARWIDPASHTLINHVMRLLRETPTNIRLASDFSELAYFRAVAEDFDGLTVVGLRESVLSPAQRVVKRAFDLTLSALALTVTAPLLAVVALAIRLDSPGSVIFRQERFGQYGKRFTMYKFRTMYGEVNAAGDSPVEASGKKNPDDPRITHVGRFLRRSSLDELPQFFNVLRGEMSLVGPRPELAPIAEGYDWLQRKRLEVPQGLTGWWQTNGRAERPLHQHIEDDLYYVRHYSVWLDLLILARTVVTVLGGRGAY